MAGLAVGMACFLLIFLWVRDELSYDRFHVNKNELYLLNIKHPGDLNGYGDPNAPFALAPVLANNYPEIVDYTRLLNLGSKTTCSFRYRPGEGEIGEKMFYEDSVYLVDTSFFSMFSFPFINGSPRTALTVPNSLVISDKIAEKYFGKEDPIGKVLNYNNLRNYTITGVVRVPANSHLRFDFIAPLINKRLNDWNWSDPSYILLKKNISLQEFRDKIAGSFNKYFPNPLRGTFKLDILPLTKNHLYFGRKIYVYIFSIIAVFILLIACINYMNLATASSVNRAKEVGIRKVVGASRHQVVKQFFGESILLSAFSLIPALILANIFLPFLNTLSGKNMALFSSENPYIFLIPVGLVIVAGIVSGSYPALILTSYKPAQTLRASGRLKTNRSLFRVISVVGQFVISILLIVCTTVVLKQLHFFQNKSLGFKTDYVVSIPINSSLLSGFNSYKNELLRNPGVLNVTAGQGAPFNEDYKSGVDWDKKDPQMVPLVRFSINQTGYMETFDMKIAAGRGFSEEFPSDRTNYMINEAAAKYMNMQEPVGERLRFWGKEGRIIGIVKDFHHVSLHRAILPQIFTINPDFYRNLQYVFIKINSGNVPETIEYIKTLTRKFAPIYPFKYSFLDNEIENLYHAEQRLGKIFSYFAFIAIFISCLGIFGLAAFRAEQRTKEIGIRKTFGASVTSIVALLSADFTKWVLLANVVALPIAWFAMHQWLRNFAYKTTMSLWIFLLSGFLALIIALAAVSYQSIKAALSNPVEALRYE
jgi:ABC-type antimicrobial peptide transport system permease subunit